MEIIFFRQISVLGSVCFKKVFSGVSWAFYLFGKSSVRVSGSLVAQKEKSVSLWLRWDADLVCCLFAAQRFPGVLGGGRVEENNKNRVSLYAGRAKCKFVSSRFAVHLSATLHRCRSSQDAMCFTYCVGHRSHHRDT